MQAGLIAYRRPFYQVLSLEPLAPSVTLSPAAQHPREGGVRPVAESQGVLHHRPLKPLFQRESDCGENQ